MLLVVLSGDRGLCGGYNNFIIKKARRRGRLAALARALTCHACTFSQSEARIKELMALGVAVKVVTIGKKVGSYYKRRPQYALTKSFDMGNSPTTAEAQASRRARTF